jgi:hypothetical protein
MYLFSTAEHFFTVYLTLISYVEMYVRKFAALKLTAQADSITRQNKSPLVLK